MFMHFLFLKIVLQFLINEDLSCIDTFLHTHLNRILIDFHQLIIILIFGNNLVKTSFILRYLCVPNFKAIQPQKVFSSVLKQRNTYRSKLIYKCLHKRRTLIHRTFTASFYLSWHQKVFIYKYQSALILRITDITVSAARRSTKDLQSRAQINQQ